MNSDSLILRELINSPLTTKNDFLTNEDFDNNNINIFNDLVALCVTTGVLEFDEFETYDDTVLNYSTYGGRLYNYVNASPSIGVTPSTDVNYWVEVFPAILAHKQNADTVLNEGGANEVTAAEIRAYIDAGITATTNLAITTKTANTFLLTSSTGADVTIPEATRLEAGLLNATDKATLEQTSGINTGDQSLTSLGAEATANKATDFSTLNDVLFPTVQAVETQIVAKIDAVINAAPAALDTLNELAAALGDDANFSATVTASIATKEATANKQDNLTVDGTGVKFPTVDAVNAALSAIPSGITIGTTAITSGTNTRALYQSAGVVSQSANFVFDASNQLVVGGHTGGARLDVKAGGALSTDLGFRVRNSADSANILTVAGNGDTRLDGRIGLNTAVNSIIDFYMSASAGTYYGHYATGTYLQAAFAAPVNTATTPTNFYAPACGNSAAYKAENTGGNATVTGVRRGFVADNFNNSAYNNVAFSSDISNSGGGEALAFDVVNGNFKFGTGTGTKIGTATGQKIGFWNATPIVQPTTAVAASTLIGGGGATITDTDTFDGYTLKQIVKALRNSGLLA
jgi:hypothetical protein